MKKTIFKSPRLLTLSYIVAAPVLTFADAAHERLDVQMPQQTVPGHMLISGWEVVDAPRKNATGEQFIDRATPALVQYAATRATEAYNATHNERKTLKPITLQKGAGIEEIGGFVEFDGTNVTLAFRGTAHENDMLTDALANPSQYPYGEGNIHAGFKQAMTTAMASILPLILNYANENHYALSQLTYLTTGHSLGGALATLAGEYLINEQCLGFDGANDGRVSTISFAAPRVGDDAFHDRYRQSFGHGNHIRFWAEGDIVPAMPFGALQGFKHVGTSFKIGTTTQLFTGLRTTLKRFVTAPWDLTNSFTQTAIATAVFGLPGLAVIPAQIIKGAVLQMHSVDAYTANSAAAYQQSREGGGTDHKGVLGNRFENVRREGGFLGKAFTSIKNKMGALQESSPVVQKAVTGVKKAGAFVAKTATGLWSSVKGLFS